MKQRTRIRRLKARTYGHYIYLSRVRQARAKARQAGRSLSQALSQALREAYERARGEMP